MTRDDAAHSPASSPLDEACQRAMNLQIAGRLELAAQMYREILQSEPRHATGSYCFGMLKVQLQEPLEGLPYLMAALEASPAVPDYWLGILEALLAAGRTEEARETLALARERGLAGTATEEFATRLELKLSHGSAASAPCTSPPPCGIPAPAPTDTSSWARIERRRASRIARRQEAALLALLKAGQFAQAEARARALTERFPDRGMGFKTLGALLWARGCRKEGVVALESATVLLPGDAEAHSNLGKTLNELERYEEAELSLKRALQIDPAFSAAYLNLADMYQAQGRYAEAEATLRSGIALRTHAAVDLPENLCHSSLLFLLSHNPALDGDSLFAEHCRIGALLESQLRSSWPRHSNVADEDRALRVGLVSGDFCNHAVANFIEPVLSRLGRCAGLELHGYYNNPAEDSVTERLRGYMQHWNLVSALPDPQMARRIMDDRIDILLDLSGHTSMNRLRVFARKPAPIQISWIGYPGTTGLRAMDYYLADRHFLPPGEFDRHFTEKLVYLPTGAPFQPHPAAPPIAPLPALDKGHLTLGSFNRIGKLNSATIALWSQLLRALPDARMLIGGIPPEPHQSDRLIERFAAQGVAAERLRLEPRGGMDAYLGLHHEVDICLDTTPYSGGTTTYHAYWMGVPTLTLAGPTPASRQGAAIMGQVGLDGFIATSAADLIDKGRYWAGHLAALAQVRAELRDRWLHSPIRGPEVIAASIERAFRHMWIRWCRRLPAESFEVASPGPAN
ncbi:MAG TPA: tetratricopeptide repeat protein [Steroidobacteraceae bacterium]|nr:tetratricopeptide repeat protein [Steroidobacteraceae bacterium]